MWSQIRVFRQLMSKSACVSILLFFTAGTAIAQVPLPTSTSSHFSGSGNCQTCHSASGSQMVENGIDISPTGAWMSSMMANSSRDPLWRAKVEAEVEAHPELQGLIEDRCTRCHAPMLNEQDEVDGIPETSFQGAIDTWNGRDGISCTLCHQIDSGNLDSETSWSGGYVIGDEAVIYGPYEDPLVMPMQNMTGFTPAHGEHMGDSALCATCHTLFTPYLDDEGQIAGEFPEQTPYLEWRNSDYSEQGIHCQDCHMPLAESPQDIAVMPPWDTTLREPFFVHQFVGGNAWMLQLLRDHGEALGVAAPEEQFDRSIQWTRAMLASSLEMTAELEDEGDSVAFDLHLRNLSGHKLPTGIPLRRLWVRLRAWQGEELVFESGSWDDEGRITGLDPGHEPHHDRISDPGQVAVYEGIMGDVNDEETYTLLRASQFLKDNRLPPAGFHSDHEDYEHTVIAGAALQDPDYNREGAQEGTGADVIHYRLPGDVDRVEAQVLYQSVTPALIDYFGTLESPRIVEFLEYYEAQGNEPEVVAIEEWSTTSVEQGSALPSGWRLGTPWPNPFNDSAQVELALDHPAKVRLSLVNLLGQEFGQLHSGTLDRGTHRFRIEAPAGDRRWASGRFFLQAIVDGKRQVRPMTLLR